MLKKLLCFLFNPKLSKKQTNEYWVRGVKYETRDSYEAAISQPKTEVTKPVRKPPSKPVQNPKVEPSACGVKKWVGWNVCGWTRVVGVTTYRHDAEFTAIYRTEGNVLSLVREPYNPHDKNAIMILDGSNLIGYIDKHTASALNKRFSNDMPIRALFKRGYAGDTGAIAVDILPQMPSSKERKAGGWEK